MSLGRRRTEDRRGGERRKSGIGNVSMDGEGGADKESTYLLLVSCLSGPTSAEALCRTHILIN